MLVGGMIQGHNEAAGALQAKLAAAEAAQAEANQELQALQAHSAQLQEQLQIQAQ